MEEVVVECRKGIAVGRPKFKKSIPVVCRYGFVLKGLSVDVVAYHVFIVDKQVVVTVQPPLYSLLNPAGISPFSRGSHHSVPS